MLASCRLGCSAIQELARGNWPSIGGAYGKPAPAPGTRKARLIALPDRGVSWREIEDRLFWSDDALEVDNLQFANTIELWIPATPRSRGSSPGGDLVSRKRAGVSSVISSHTRPVP